MLYIKPCKPTSQAHQSKYVDFRGFERFGKPHTCGLKWGTTSCFRALSLRLYGSITITIEYVLLLVSTLPRIFPMFPCQGITSWVERYVAQSPKLARKNRVRTAVHVVRKRMRTRRRYGATAGPGSRGSTVIRQVGTPVLHMCFLRSSTQASRIINKQKLTRQLIWIYKLR